jgi:hypothetical protein
MRLALYLWLAIRACLPLAITATSLPRALPHLNKANWRYHSFAAKPNGEARANKRRDEQRSEQSEVE